VKVLAWRNVSEMTYNLLSGTLNLTHSLTNVLKGPHFRMAKNWQNSGFVTKFCTEFALFDEQKMAFLAAKSFGA